MKRTVAAAAAFGLAFSCASSVGVGRLRVPSTPEAKSCSNACEEQIGQCYWLPSRQKEDPELKGATCKSLHDECALNCPGVCLERAGGQCFDKAQMVDYQRRQGSGPTRMLLYGPDGGLP